MREKRRRSGNLYCAESSLFYRSTACRLRYLVMWFTFVPVGPRAVHASMQYRRRVRRRPTPQPPSAARRPRRRAALTIVKIMHHATTQHRRDSGVRTSGAAGAARRCRIEFTMVMDSVTKPQNAYQRHGFWRGGALVPGTDGGPSAQAFAFCFIGSTAFRNKGEGRRARTGRK
jgi:hypothetical protein